MDVAKVEILLPVVFGEIVFSGTNMVTDGSTLEGGVICGHRFGAEAFEAEELVDRFGMDRCKEFSLGIGPGIFRCAGDVNSTGCDEGDELMLVDGEGVFLVVVFFVVPAEPMWEGLVNASD